ncbi:M20/M25/M40 family metallo-hydrolase [Leptolyngbya sp. 15MV]|nr:M20/M25/M40 family metallo-hydrolase [Leptolyngbya sp. 15MV]
MPGLEAARTLAPEPETKHSVFAEALLAPQAGRAERVFPYAKRAIDIAGAVALLLFTAPLFLALALLIRMDGGRVFYAHERIGRAGRAFGCLKFRSMVMDSEARLAELLARNPAARAEWEATRKLKNDPRVTWVGRFLRASSLDELPQLINVLKGEMSLVGPRPVQAAELATFYGAAAQHYVQVRPGLTGPWQVSGRNDTSYAQRVALDVAYVARPSLVNDIRILLRTPMAVLQNPTRIEGDKFYGCGIFDMKANIILMIEAFRYFALNGIQPARPINILLSCDEEVGSYTGREYVEREAALAEACLVFEPSANGSVKTGRKGTGMYTIRAHGVPAHAGLEPEKGASAILEIARQIERLQSLNDTAIGTTVNVCTASGGTTTNVIPEHAECTVDVRFGSMAEAERIDLVIRSLKSVDERVSIEVTGGINRPPMERTTAVVALYEKALGIAESFDYELGETQVGGASDGNFVGALGIPVLDGLGIAGDGAHTLDEHILISDIAKRATLITLFLKT